MQEMPGPLQALRKSLETHHCLFFAKSIDEALSILETNQIDLIISRVHLERASVFEFIKAVKQNPLLSSIPFVCFCGKRTEIAKLLDETLAKAAHMTGADRYLILEQFCSENDCCDFDRLRREIESCIPEICR